MEDNEFCLQWNNHKNTLISIFGTLLDSQKLVDCTLAAEGKYIKAHKIVLMACSPYFDTLLSEEYDKHPIFILKDIKFQELRAIMDYMYRGQVNISQDDLTGLLKAAETLQIKGLCDSRSSSSSAEKNDSKADSPQKIDPVDKATKTKRAQKPRKSGATPNQGRKSLVESNNQDRGDEIIQNAKRFKSSEDIQYDDEDDDYKDDDLTLDDEFLKDIEAEMSQIDVDSSNQENNSQIDDRNKENQDSGKQSKKSTAAKNTPGSSKLGTSAVTTIVPESDKKATKPKRPRIKFTTKKNPKTVKSNKRTQSLPNTSTQSNNISNEEMNDSEFSADDADLSEDDQINNSVKSEGNERKTKKSKLDTTVSDQTNGSDDEDPDRQYDCRHCGKRYRWKSTLRRHENVECGGKEASHQCPYCSYKAKQRGNLGVHIRKHHADKPPLETRRSRKTLSQTR